MIRLCFCLFSLLLLTSCGSESYKDQLADINDAACVVDTTQYPRKTSDGRLVVLHGKMTADKGLKLYPDTVESIAINGEQDKLLRDALKDPH
jgi:hypothetical protein